jgi:hypothetical protein
MFRKLLFKRALLSVAMAGFLLQTTIVCELPSSIVIGISGDGHDDDWDDDDWDDDDWDDDDWDDCCDGGDWWFDWWWF